ncbi:MAG: hypothetical protein CM15mP38_3450 [Synechococcus sp.]|nr:MAG: hypothetical protein CM15mP38_3450 [Synechococcus sp.]
MEYSMLLSPLSPLGPVIRIGSSRKLCLDQQPCRLALMKNRYWPSVIKSRI